MLIDDKGRIFGKINLIDFFILIICPILILSLSVIGYKNFNKPFPSLEFGICTMITDPMPFDIYANRKADASILEFEKLPEKKDDCGFFGGCNKKNLSEIRYKIKLRVPNIYNIGEKATIRTDYYTFSGVVVDFDKRGITEKKFLTKKEIKRRLSRIIYDDSDSNKADH
jgi:hypothetical protein